MPNSSVRPIFQHCRDVCHTFNMSHDNFGKVVFLMAFELPICWSTNKCNSFSQNTVIRYTFILEELHLLYHLHENNSIKKTYFWPFVFLSCSYTFHFSFRVFLNIPVCWLTLCRYWLLYKVFWGNQIIGWSGQHIREFWREVAIIPLSQTGIF